MSDPSSLIAQVGRDGSTAQAPAARPANNAASKAAVPWYKKVFCCCADNEDSASSSSYANRRSGNPTPAVARPQQEGVQGVAGESHAMEYLLPPMAPNNIGKKCLVLDLDETLVHSSFKPISNADFVIPVEIEDQIHQVYVVKRPHVDEFMERLGPTFEIVVFTASLAKYADPVLDLLDKSTVVHYRLFREACTNHKGNYVKDLGRLGRPLNSVIIVDNSPASYMFHPENAVPIDSWFDDETDTELLDLIPFLEDMSKVDDVCSVLSSAS